jgi:hypothetical protein
MRSFSMAGAPLAPSVDAGTSFRRRRGFAGVEAIISVSALALQALGLESVRDRTPSTDIVVWSTDWKRAFHYDRNVMARTAPLTDRERTSQPGVGLDKKATLQDSSLKSGNAGLSESVQEGVAHLADGYWLERQKGGSGGSAEEDWLRAEREFRERQVSHD